MLHQDKPKGQQQGIWNSAHLQWGKKKLQSFITSSSMESFYVAWIKIKSRLWDMVIRKQKVVVDLSEGLWGKLPWSYPTSYYPRSRVPSFFCETWWYDLPWSFPQDRFQSGHKIFCLLKARLQCQLGDFCAKLLWSVAAFARFHLKISCVFNTKEAKSNTLACFGEEKSQVMWLLLPSNALHFH